MPAFLTLDDFEWKGKTVLVRIDGNSSIDEKTGLIASSDRLEAHARTLKELSVKGARVVILAHQGRKGDADCIPLKQHAVLLSKFVGKKVGYVDDVHGVKAQSAVKALKDGELLLLENVRFSEEESAKMSVEEFSKTRMVSDLAPLAHAFVLDGFSVSHRAQVSVVGFAVVLPAFAGRVMEAEVRSLSTALEHPEKPVVLIVGGSKADDSMAMVSFWLRSGVVDKVLCGGVPATILLAASGVNIGKANADFLEKKQFTGLIPTAKELLGNVGEKIVLPLDVGCEKNGKRVDVDVHEGVIDAPIFDVGPMTAARYAEEIRASKTVIMNGPVGVYEDAKFASSTKTVLQAIAGTKCFSLLGGGNTLAAVHDLGIDASKISYPSLAGKAFVEFLMGKELPGVKVLEQAAEKKKK
ncbi:phosphoglycerate kinase [Candidatus Micrarchaeota archaeon]|nr:phosphoglycerate kinase [Candidatus Micrarchaeota archaeon]